MFTKKEYDKINETDCLILHIHTIIHCNLQKYMMKYKEKFKRILEG